MHRYPAQVRADLQRYYGLNLDRFGVDFGAFHAGACLCNLPIGSATMAAIDERATYTRSEYMLHAIMCGLVGKAIPYPWEKKRGIDGIETEAVPLDEFREWYEHTNWKEAGEWQEIQ